MGHSILIGWYNPASKRFCYKDEKETRPDNYKSYTLPVYAVSEEGKRITINSNLVQEFVDWTKDKAFCNSGQHICDRLANKFEQALKEGG